MEILSGMLAAGYFPTRISRTVRDTVFRRANRLLGFLFAPPARVLVVIGTRLRSTTR